jgi:hypothetical protein
MKKNPLSFRFHCRGEVNNSESQESIFFHAFISQVTNREVIQVTELDKHVDIEIEIGIITNNGIEVIPGFATRISRYIQSKSKSGIKFDGGKRTPNLQPRGKSKYSFYWTGENERPPEGTWDAYFTFDVHSFQGRNHYLPLWWITSSDVLVPTTSPYLGAPITTEELSSGRKVDFESRKNFCCAFIGKAYPFRMHALSALSEIENVDVFGGVGRRMVSSKLEIAKEYRFVFAFENDLYPGYVTEKVFEAWATGAIPIYWGSDPEGYINPKAIINLADFANMEKFVEFIKEVNSNPVLWESIASQPLLLRKPSLESTIENTRKIISDLCDL